MPRLHPDEDEDGDGPKAKPAEHGLEGPSPYSAPHVRVALGKWWPGLLLLWIAVAVGLWAAN